MLDTTFIVESNLSIRDELLHNISYLPKADRRAACVINFVNWGVGKCHPGKDFSDLINMQGQACYGFIRKIYWEAFGRKHNGQYMVRWTSYFVITRHIRRPDACNVHSIDAIVLWSLIFIEHFVLGVLSRTVHRIVFVYT